MKRGLLFVDQLARPVPGGIGVYINGILQGLVQLQRDRQLDLLTSKTEDPILPTGWQGEHVKARFDYRIQQRLWDRGFSISRGPWEFYHAFSLGGPLLRMPVPSAVAVYDLLFRTSSETFPPPGQNLARTPF